MKRIIIGYLYVALLMLLTAIVLLREYPWVVDWINNNAIR